jgi:sigma-B regulation protein RsbU (phosphoserine phosphatase)
MSEQALKLKILQLEQLLLQKDEELDQYKAEVVKTNEVLTQVLHDLQNQIKLALAIQRSLSPTEVPQMPGFEFSSKFVPGIEQGGDYFDFFDLPEKMKFALVLSCASGYGLSALLLSLILKVAAKYEGKVGLHPGLFFQYLSEKLSESLTEKDSAQLFYGVFDRKSLKLEWGYAGEMGVFLYRAKDRAWVRLEPGAPSLIKGFSGQVLSETLRLDSRDRLVLCSTGWINTVGPDLAQKLLQKLSLQASVHEVRNELLLFVQRQFGDQPAKRDLTILVLEVKDQLLRLA